MTNQQLNESRICRFIAKPPDAMYDIGVGPKSEWRTLGRKYARMRVFGCEPNPILHKRISEAGFPGPLEQVAIAPGEAVQLHVPSRDLKLGSILPLAYADQVYQVKAWTLDEFDNHAGQPSRILLWMDIEGSELSALQSGERLLQSGRVRWINLEERRNGHCPAKGWSHPDELQTFLAAHGYRRAADYNRHPTHQDVIYV